MQGKTPTTISDEESRTVRRDPETTANNFEEGDITTVLPVNGAEKVHEGGDDGDDDILWSQRSPLYHQFSLC